MAKRMMDMIFQLDGYTPKGQQDRLADINELLQYIRVPKEFSRRVRPIDYAKYKSQVYFSKK
jgi:hypothetical protein